MGAWFIRALLGLTMVCTAFVPAQAAGSAPEGEWIVGPIAAKAQDGRSYCSMKNVYAGGVALVFARDALGTNSIAIDFSRTPIKPLVEGDIYPVTLMAGPAYRDVTALAAGQKVLVLQMGSDDAFYDMLARKDILTASFGDNEFSFGLQGTSKALIALDNCVASFTPGGGMARPKTGLPPVFSDAAQGFDPPIVSAAASAPVIKVIHPAEDKPLLREDGGALEAARLRAENRALELENAAVLAKLRAAELRKMENDSRMEAAFEERGRALEAENSRLQAALAAAQAETGKKEELARRLTNMEKLNRQLQQEKAESLAKAIAAVEPAAGPPHAESIIQSMLAQKKNVKRAEGEYAWESNGLLGSVEEYPAAENGNLRAFMDSYIAATGKSCPGDFAFTLADSVRTAMMETAEAELACIDNAVNAAAAVLFVSDPKKIFVVTYEGSAGQMPDALKERASVFSSLQEN